MGTPRDSGRELEGASAKDDDRRCGHRDTFRPLDYDEAGVCGVTTKVHHSLQFRRPLRLAR